MPKYSLKRSVDGVVVHEQSANDLMHAAATGQIVRGDQVLPAGSTKWIPAEKVTGIKEHIRRFEAAKVEARQETPVEPRSDVEPRSEPEPEFQLTPEDVEKFEALLAQYESGIEDLHDTCLEALEEAEKHKRKMMWTVLAAIGAVIGAAFLINMATRKNGSDPSATVMGTATGNSIVKDSLGGVIGTVKTTMNVPVPNVVGAELAREAGTKRIAAAAGGAALVTAAGGLAAYSFYQQGKSDGQKLTVFDSYSLMVRMLDEFFGQLIAPLPRSFTAQYKERLGNLAEKYADVLVELAGVYSSKFGVNMRDWNDDPVISPDRLITRCWYTPDEELVDRLTEITSTWGRFVYIDEKTSRRKSGAPRGIMENMAYKAGSVLGWPSRISGEATCKSVFGWFASIELPGINPPVVHGEDERLAASRQLKQKATLPVTLGFLLCLLGIGSLIGAMLTVASLQTALIAVGGFGYVFGVIMLFLATPRAYGLLGQRELVPVYWIGLIVVSLIPPFGWALLMILIFAIGTIRPAKKWSLGAVASSQFADETERFMNDLASMPDPERHLYWYNSLGQELEMKADKSSKRRMRRRQAKSRNSEQS